MSILEELEKEIKDSKAVPENARIVIEIAKQVSALEINLPNEIIFRAAVQAVFGLKVE